MSLDPIASAALSVRHGFFTRKGGVSQGPFASLNGSLTFDERDAVLENRARVARWLGTQPELLLGVSQYHSDVVATVTEPWLPGQGPRADAMVTATPGLGLVIITADCAPVLFADAARGVVGAAHAGWRGAAGGVLEATLDAMRALGAEQIAASIGPCIQQASYEVGVDMRDAVLAQDAQAEGFFAEGADAAHWQFDLSGFCAARLRRAGAIAEPLALDTLSDDARFYSHRRRTLAGGGPIGHQMSAIVL